MPTPQRSYNMSQIRSRDTKPEMIVRQFLWSRGFRYRLVHSMLPGRPDIVLRRYRTCIFVNGCFWHGHGLAEEEVAKAQLIDDGRKIPIIESSDCCKIPKTNQRFWIKKIVRNIEHDQDVQKILQKMGWNCITIWECELKKEKQQQTLESLAYTLNKIFLESKDRHDYNLDSDNDNSLAAESEF